MSSAILRVKSNHEETESMRRSGYLIYLIQVMFFSATASSNAKAQTEFDLIFLLSQLLD